MPQRYSRSTGLRVKRISIPEELKKAFAIRLKVFVREQGVPREIELDAEDAKAAHFLATLDGRAVGTARVVLKGSQAKIGRMAVLKSYRGRGVGKKLLLQSMGLCRSRRAKTIFLHAQVEVSEFYRKMGFRPVGRVFSEAGILHRKMIFKP